MKHLAALLLLATTALAAEPLHRLKLETPQDLQALLHYSGEPLPLVSAHRGGPAKDYPENCIATFEHTLAHTFSMLEIDPRRTKDGAIVVHHDATLERTTTGTGKVVDATLAELKQLRLKDTEGHATEHQLPTLDEVIEWARGKTVLVLDQKDVTAVERAEIVTRLKAEAYVMLIVSSFKEVVAVHRVNPNITMEVMIPTLAKAEEFDGLGVPWKNVVAFVGHVPPEDKALYDYIHGKGACTMIGTSRNLDRKVIQGEVKDIKLLEPEYRAFLNRGADIIETDIPVPLGTMLYGSAAVPKGKAGLFEKR
ncbi:glycerophosphodiester phosphodiesterase family protein [Brevifollis gellanilyticus]|uniref:Glycerophosphoryl diester phosphodiesterase n=1 Tax=Brevifollis gellanilyticus TaxID=748831 RepID=A0A512MCP9_9BACT|nr:glycerophosphodiester phosphodiesterase family protein [Brevifollis gellanilyticus]GEP44513.1 glycerophosphoryl diester phosphodiesterase [Brevifollis gellanilyticus]